MTTAVAIVMVSMGFIVFLHLAVSCENSKNKYHKDMQECVARERRDSISRLLEVYGMLRAAGLLDEIAPAILHSDDVDCLFRSITTKHILKLKGIAVQLYVDGETEEAVALMRRAYELSGNYGITNSDAITALEDRKGYIQTVDAKYATMPNKSKSRDKTNRGGK